MRMQVRVLLVALVALFTAGQIVAQDFDENLEDLPGYIALVGQDYNVYTIDFDSGTRHQLTDDAAPSRRYQWPTISQDGRLAYFCCDLRYSQDLQTQAFISADGQQEGAEVFSGMAETVIYAYWAPSACSAEAGCLDLAMLVNNVALGLLFVEVVRDGQEPSSEVIGRGSPFYYSYSGGGEQMAFHRNNEQIEIYDVATDTVVQTLERPSSGAFQAPAWSPVDDRVLYGARSTQSGPLTDLVIFEDGETRTLVEGLDGLVSFLWSPDGRYVAYRTVNQDGFGALFVLDSTTGEVLRRSLDDGVAAFFWSPDSARVGYITFGTDDDGMTAEGDTQRTMIAQSETNAGLRWAILEIESGLNRAFDTFLPTYEMLYLIQYFDQFAQSHSVWSPDSTHLVYSELIENNGETEALVNLLDVTQANSQPMRLGNGVFGVWSFD